MNKKLKYYPITHGQLVAAWQIIFLANRYKNITPKSVIEITIRSGKLGGTLPAKEGLRICLDYSLLKIDDGAIQVTQFTYGSILPKCDNEDLNVKALRTLLSHIISYHNFEWLLFYDSDPEIFRDHLMAQDTEWSNLLDNAKLFDFGDEDVNNWWAGILVKYEDYKEKIKKAIGDVGEKLTYHHELNRVELDGYEAPKSFVKWAALMSDRFGFDIQSIRGAYFKSSYDKKDKIRIEVKSSDTTNIERFRFFVSKPEWNKALENINSYFFFCWVGININDESALHGPFVIPATQLMESVPKDVSSICEWSECRVVLDISHYRWPDSI
jgi:hypothetical protein